MAPKQTQDAYIVAAVRTTLAPNGTIIMQEQAYASGTKSFEKFIDQGGLRIVDVYWEPVDQMHLYYIDLTHK